MIFYNTSTNSAAFVQYSKCLSYPFPFYATQIINPFPNSRISANHDKVEVNQPSNKRDSTIEKRA